MENIEPVRREITTLVAQNCGQKIGTFFSNTYAGEILPIFLHHSFLVLKEMVGEQKARELVSNILRKYSLTVPYE